MDKIRQILINALGEKAAADFIKSALECDEQSIKKRVGALLDTRKPENRLVYEVLIREKTRLDGFKGEEYKKLERKDRNSTFKGEPSTISSIQAEHSTQDTQSTNTKKKVKYYPLFSEGAQADQIVTLLPGRHPCQCLATKHKLINNCSSCGRIVCEQENSGPCYFCGNLVCTREEYESISLGTKQAEKLRNRLLHANWAPGVDLPPYRVKRQIMKAARKMDSPDKSETNTELNLTNEEEDDDEVESGLFRPVLGAQERLEEGLVAALAKRDRLLEFDATSVRRTKVIDDELDYFASEGGGSAIWISPEVRERIAKRVAELRAQRHGSRLESVRMCIDFAGRCTIEDTRDEAARQLYRPDQSVIEEMERPSAKPSQSHERNIDPSVNIVLPNFVPPDINSKESHHLKQICTPLTNALRQPLAECRVQDDESRQLVDDGYCLSMHQPWASLLVRGIKRDEGRTWYTAHRGCLWIASTAKQPDAKQIAELEQFYVKNGISKADLPGSYPVGCLLGRVNVLDCLNQEEYRTKYPDGPSESPFVLVCDDPREVLIRFPIRGQHKIYKLENHIHLAAKKNLA